ncbi:09ca7413-954f-4f00-add6-706d4471e9ca [Thermothielavioides terrestris]|uniref:09ca7413-954f-4f00-add6-706d4471e9ca n=1 Tax=Thermothielavioides terrestris TaxID=2587410 RepID=A0A3S4D963_9PEZI|nr:09ca7413-954f-4f00-add6-706d4471e9ca [Thermothielavioides terrestris]
MAAKLQIHTPYVLQTLPRPLDGPDRPGRYHAGEVFGQKHGCKRRKRTELAVAVDGVAVYIYDVLSSQAATSYLVSPQSVFTCAPYSLRWRPASSKTTTRYTYVSLSTNKSSSVSAQREIKLFKEETSGAGTTMAAPVSRALHCDAPIIHIFASSPRHSPINVTGGESPNNDLFAVAADGTILCLNGETLEERWQTAPSALSKELLTSSKTGLHVDFAQLTSAADVVDGMFGGRSELFGVFQEPIHREGFNPDFLVVITSQGSSHSRHLHLLALPSEREARQTNDERLISVFVAPFPAEAGQTQFQLDVRSGTLQSLSGGAIATYGFNNGIPRLENKLQLPERWVFYAIGRVFAWDQQSQGSKTSRLVCRLPESNVLNYLVDAGHLSTSNIKSAFKHEVREADEVDDFLGEEVPTLLAQVDPTMELLVGYISGTQLGPTELVASIKLLLRSLGLFEDSFKFLQARLTESGEQGHDHENEAVNRALDRAEEELEITEHYLGGHRTRGLGVAFSKLGACPAGATVRSLRRLFRVEEIIGLMNVLRAELIKDGWTTRYLDRTSADQDEIDAPPDGSIQLIADLMSRCIDSVGLAGWMASDTMLAGSRNQEDSADFFSQFQAEVSVALEGVMEAVRLQGALAETVSYARRARKAYVESTKGKAVSMHLTEELPLGLKTDSRISAERVRSGGEIVPRSSRQIGHFVGKKRGVYSVQRISEETLLGGGGAAAVRQGR